MALPTEIENCYTKFWGEEMDRKHRERRRQQQQRSSNQNQFNYTATGSRVQLDFKRSSSYYLICGSRTQFWIWTTWAYPFGGRYSQAVLFSVEATDLADLSDEVDVFLILRLLTLASLVFSIEVEETAGQDEVPAGVRRPAVERRRQTLTLCCKTGKFVLILMFL